MEDGLPTDHDVIVVGTGMPESIVAAAVARVGRKILHLDRESHYGGLWASYNFDHIREWINKQAALVINSENSENSNFESFLHPGERFVTTTQSFMPVKNVKELINISQEGPDEDASHLPNSLSRESRSSEGSIGSDHVDLQNDEQPEEDLTFDSPASVSPTVPPSVDAESLASSTVPSPGPEVVLPNGNESSVDVVGQTTDEHGQPNVNNELTSGERVAVASPSSRNGNSDNRAYVEGSDEGISTATHFAEQSQEQLPTQESSQFSSSGFQERMAAFDGSMSSIHGPPASLAAPESHNSEMSENTFSSPEPSNVDSPLSQHPERSDFPSEELGSHSVGSEGQNEPSGEQTPDSVGSQSAAANELSKVKWSMNKLARLCRKFNLDLAPKLLFSRGALVELLISSNISRYAEFKCVTRVLTFIDQHLEQVPCSRADVFSTKHVSVVEKRMLMKLLTFCLEYHKHPEEYRGFEGRPFREFLKSRKLTASVEHYILYAIAMVDEETPTLEALKSTQRFLESLGKYGNSPFLASLYGSGEIPQCFCRLCAVYGGIYHLQRGIDAIIFDAENKCRGIVSRGTRFNCQFVVMEASYAPLDYLPSEEFSWVSRAIILTDASLYPAATEQITLLRFPPQNNSKGSIIILEFGPGAMVCPKGLFVVHMTCKSLAPTAEEDLYPAISLLFNVNKEEQSSTKPNILWAIFFNVIDSAKECLNRDVPPGVFLLSSPGADLDYEHHIKEARDIFEAMYPGEEFLPRAPDPEEILLEFESNPGEHHAEGEGAKSREDVKGDEPNAEDSKPVEAALETAITEMHREELVSSIEKDSQNEVDSKNASVLIPNEPGDSSKQTATGVVGDS